MIALVRSRAHQNDVTSFFAEKLRELVVQRLFDLPAVLVSSEVMGFIEDDQIVIRAMMKLTLSVDHRIVDGTVGALFVNALKMKLEDVELWKSLT